MKAIAFVTLFLGLVVGEQTVELIVAPHVQSVEILLDRQPVGVLTEPPWRMSIDLGPELIPHLLVAVARDNEGRELTRVSQWINLARDPFEIDLSLRPTPEGLNEIDLAWESALGSGLTSMRISIDDQVLPLTQDGRASLPALDPDVPHLLRVEASLGERRLSAVELLSLSSSTGVTQAELTAVPIISSRRRPPGLSWLDGRLRARGQPIRIHGLERREADLVLVVDQLAKSLLVRSLVHATELKLDDLPEPGQQPGKDWEGAYLAHDRHLLIVGPRPLVNQGLKTSFGLFQVSQPIAPLRGPLPLVAASARVPESDEPLGPQCLADAVAVAGRTAASRFHRRAVLLILSPYATDESRLSPAQARRYLESLHVPLIIWCVGCPARHDQPWGDVVDIGARGQLNRAIRALEKQLDRQTIVWLEGLHLPQEIEQIGSTRRARIAR